MACHARRNNSKGYIKMGQIQGSRELLWDKGNLKH